MKESIDFYRFRDWFRNSETYNNNFTDKGLIYLYDYLMELEADCGIEEEFDPIGICCEFIEYENFEEFKKENVGIDTIEELEENTTVIIINECTRPNYKPFSPNGHVYIPPSEEQEEEEPAPNGLIIQAY